MADNIAITAGSGTTVATDEVGSAHYQYVKLAFGADGTATIVSVSNPLPTQGPVADDAAAAGFPVPVGGIYNSTLPTYTNGDRTQAQLGSRGSLHVELWGTDAAVPLTFGTATNADAIAASGTFNKASVVNFPFVFNGTTWDRQRGDATNGADVDVTRLPGQGLSASATFTPAAASHTAGDANGAAAEFAFGAPSAGSIMITSASLEIDGGTAEATNWRLYLFSITPPSAVADDGAFTLASGDRASHLGYVDLGTAVDLGDTQWVEAHGINKQIKLAGTSVFGYLVNLTTLTPANVAHIVKLEATVV